MIPRWLQKELYVVAHGQTAQFRIIKWIIILVLLSVLFVWKGWTTVIFTIILGAMLGISLHFFLRWKTDAWTKPWGKIKPIKTPFDN